MKKALVSIIALSITGLTCTARQLTPEEALSRLQELPDIRLKNMVAAPSRPQLVYTASEESENLFYIFNKNHGFAIISADDIAMPLLGYCDSGTFDSRNVPDNMQWWLSQYRQEILHAIKSSDDKTSIATLSSRPQRQPIAPLVKAKWNQSAPYNDLCPKVDRSTCYTGCVATAMAQIMHYHKYPSQGKGSHSYTWNDQELSQDFSSVTYDWENMTDTYGSASTAAENDAVATLMLSCGISVDMNYGTGGSGVTSNDAVPYALYTYFGYDKGITLAERSFYDIFEWEELIYDNLLTSGPIYYTGTNNFAGHAFVCDGYSADGYFHFNWGWGGMSDGYFLLSALDPTSQGIGGSSDGYNMYQTIVLGIQPPKENSEFEQHIACNGTLSATYDTTSRSVTLAGGFFNYTTLRNDFTAWVGAKLTDADGNNTYIYSDNKALLPYLYGWNSYSITLPSDLADGHYTLTPAYYTALTQGSGIWNDILIKKASPQYAIVDINNGQATVGTPSVENICVTEFSLDTPLYIGEKFGVSATIFNPSTDHEIYSGISIGLVTLSGNQFSLAAYTPTFMMSLQPEEERNVTLAPAFAYGNPSAGTYYLLIFDPTTGRVLTSNAIAVNLQEAPTATTVIEATSWSVDAPDKDDIRVTANLRCRAGYFASPIMMYIFEYNESDGYYYYTANIPSETIFMSGGEEKEVTFSGRFSEGTPGETYLCRLAGDNKYLSSKQIIVTLPENAAITEVRTDSEATTILYPNPTSSTAQLHTTSPIKSIDAYTLTGAKAAIVVDIVGHYATLHAETLANGIYILRVTTDTGTNTVKLIKR